MKRANRQPFRVRRIDENRLLMPVYQNTETKLAVKILFLVLLSIFNFSPVSAQTAEDDKPINVDTLLFTIPLTVSDEKGRTFPGLKKENFKIYQDGDEQDIEFVLNEEAPMNVAILLDTSYSTKDVLDEIQKAARNFVKILRPEDKALIVTFDNRTMFLSTLTSDRKVLTKAIDRAQISQVTGSEMYDAISMVLNNNFRTLKGRKAIVALTDGVVTGRSISVQQILDSMQESDTIFYPIIFRTNFYSKAKTQNKGSKLINILEILAEETTGKFYEKEATKLKEAFQSIAEDLKKQYLIGFYPQNTESGKASGYIRVDVDRKGLIVRSKKRLKF